MEALRVLVIAALEIEARTVAGALGLERVRGQSFLWKKDGLVCVGVGLRAKKLQRALAVLPEHRPQLIILAGLAGALDPRLRIGDVVVDSPFPNLQTPPSASAGRIFAAAELLSTPDAKRQLFQSSGCAAVEMEAAAVAPMAAQAGVPLLHVRAISDTATDRVDEDWLSLVDIDGRPQPARVAALLLRKPSAMRQLLRLRRDSSFALRRLGQTMRQLAASGWLPA